MEAKYLQALSAAALRLLRPLVRILLRGGISYKTFADLVKWVYVDVAMKEFGIAGRKQSISRVSVITGLSRKEVLRVRRLSEPGASIVATVCVFVCTLLLHSYQFFWLSGTFRVSVRDFLFWGVVCGIVLVDMQRERRQLRKRRTRPAGRPGIMSRDSISLVLRTAATLLIMTILWSMWSSDSMDLTDWAEIAVGVVAP